MVNNKKSKKKERKLNKPDDVIATLAKNKKIKGYKVLKNNLFGITEDYNNIGYTYDEINDNYTGFTSLDAYDSRNHKFLGHHEVSTTKHSVLEYNSNIILSIDEFNNSVSMQSSDASYYNMTQRKRDKTFTKKEMKSFMKLANKDSRTSYNDILDDESDNSDTEKKVFDTIEDMHVSDEEADRYLDSNTGNGGYAAGIIYIDSEKVQIYGIATKSGFLNFKVIYKQNKNKTENLSYFLNHPIYSISSFGTINSKYIGMGLCKLSNGDIFFIDFTLKNEGIQNTENDIKIICKYIVLRKTQFQNNKLIDINTILFTNEKGKAKYIFAAIDRYGNYTHGTVENTQGEPILKLTLDSSNNTKSSRPKGNMLDLFNIELHYKQIISGLSEETVLLADNSKILSVNGKTKETILVTNHKFWSRIIECCDLQEYIIIVTNLEISICKKILSPQGDTLLERNISIKQYYNLLNYMDIKVNACIDKKRNIMTVLVKPMNTIYFLKVDAETGEITLINNIPLLLKVKNPCMNNRDYVYLKDGSIFTFQTYLNKTYLMEFKIDDEISPDFNLNFVKKLVLRPNTKNFNEKQELPTSDNISRIICEYKVKTNVKKSLNNIIKGIVNKPVLKYDSEQEAVLSSFGNTFFEALKDKSDILDTICGSISAAEILPINCEITNTNQFGEFIAQLVQTINVHTPFKAIQKYDGNYSDAKSMWENLLLVINTDALSTKQSVINSINERSSDDEYAILTKTIAKWNPRRFEKQFGANIDIHSQDRYNRTVKNNTDTSLLFSQYGDETSSALSSQKMPLHWNNESLVVSTQKQSQQDSQTSLEEPSETSKEGRILRKKKKSSLTSSQRSSNKINKPKKSTRKSGFF